MKEKRQVINSPSVRIRERCLIYLISNDTSTNTVNSYWN